MSASTQSSARSGCSADVSDDDRGDAVDMELMARAQAALAIRAPRPPAGNPGLGEKPAHQERRR